MCISNRSRKYNVWKRLLKKQRTALNQCAVLSSV